jgi:hypothetical protein
MPSSSHPLGLSTPTRESIVATLAVAVLLLVVLSIGLCGMLIAQGEPTANCPPSGSACAPLPSPGR